MPRIMWLNGVFKVKKTKSKIKWRNIILCRKCVFLEQHTHLSMCRYSPERKQSGHWPCQKKNRLQTRVQVCHLSTETKGCTPRVQMCNVEFINESLLEEMAVLGMQWEKSFNSSSPYFQSSIYKIVMFRPLRLVLLENSSNFKPHILDTDFGTWCEPPVSNSDWSLFQHHLVDFQLARAVGMT